jgi:hypothetical protein
MAMKKSSRARKKKAVQKVVGKKKPGTNVGNLISDAIRDPGVRAALYKNPGAVAKRYGLTNAEGKAMQTLKRSLLSSLDRNQVKQLEAIIRLPVAGAGWGGGGCNPDCSPNRVCTPTTCNPNCGPVCDPMCGPNSCNPPCNPKTL